MSQEPAPAPPPDAHPHWNRDPATRTTPRRAPLLLRAAGTALLLDTSGPGLPRVLHWGADPGDLDIPSLRELADNLATGRAADPGLPDPGLPLLPQECDLWSGHPGIAGHRDGRDCHPRLTLDSVAVSAPEDGGQEIDIRAQDPGTGLRLHTVLRMERSGLVRLRHHLTNTGPTTYTLQALHTLLPLPSHATELLDLTGRWCSERTPQRTPFHHGTHLRANRRGRTGHDATLLLLAGTPGFAFRTGEVWGTHVAWSGNHLHLAERLPEGAGAGGNAVLGGGELLHPGEIRLAPHRTHTTPWTCFTWSDAGLDGASDRIHDWLRARPTHPRTPRPLTLNTWEAVYFEHDLGRLTALAERAHDVGVERFVLDDGWFLGRRDDTAGLGDWYVDPDVWPDGLRPLADRVRELGMEFGLWVEPEMVSPNSQLARDHPDWVLAGAGRWPVPLRSQVSLDVAHPGARSYLSGRLHALISEIGIDYLKWDHNRDLHEAVHDGAPGIHAQTLAVYSLIDELRSRHPHLEIESCSSGGARVDLGILARTDRVWASDTNDPLERQSIQRWTGLLLPPELVGCHVGPPVAHTTGRTSDLGLRCLTALVGHAGIEWDITECTAREVERLRAWSGLYKELRGLLHTGRLVRADHADPTCWLHGVVSRDRAEAVFVQVRLATTPQSTPARLRLPGLAPALEYDLRRRDEIGADGDDTGSVPPAGPVPPWWDRGHARATGAVLERIGLPAPALHPGQAVLFQLRAR
ncbi:MAG: alpha-galactosidase [Actinomycetota bacterium]|nr:alpha-galactosidase [Actinomycetota bacterium]